jgi:hypothetical protein
VKLPSSQWNATILFFMAGAARGGGFPTTGWAVKDGTVKVMETGGEEAGNGGEIVTRDPLRL